MGEGGARADAGDRLRHRPDIAVVYVLYQSEDVDLSWIPGNAAALVIAVHNDGARCTRLSGSGIKVVHLVPPQNLGFGAAVNLAADQVTAERLILVNPDTRLDRCHWDALARDTAEDEVVTIPLLDGDVTRTYTVRAYPGPFRHLLGGFRAGRIIGRRSRLRAVRSTTEDEVYPMATHWASGAAFSVSFRRFRSVGGFDPAYFLYYEDVDLCSRLAAAAAMSVRLRATAPGLHIVGASAGRSVNVEQIRLDSAITWSDRQPGTAWRAAGSLLRLRRRMLRG